MTRRRKYPPTSVVGPMSGQLLSRLGLVGTATGIIGALGAVLLLAWPAQVAEGPVSYPFTITGFYVAQAWFFVHHLGMVAVLLGLAISGAVGLGRIARAGAWLAVSGTVLLAGAELLAMRYADSDFATANAGLMGAAYAVSSKLIGIGVIVAGVGLLRTRDWTGWRRWMPLLVGVTEFLVLTPGIMGGFVIARLSIGFWMLIFAALGWALHVESRRAAPTLRPSVRIA